MQQPSTATSPSQSPNPPLKKASPDSTRRHLGKGALIGGAALLNASSVIYLLLWSESYRDIAPIGPILLLLGICGIILGLMVAHFANVELALVGAIYLAATTVLLLLMTSFELLGYQDGLATPFSGGSIIVPILGVAMFAVAGWLFTSPQRKPKRKQSPETAAPAGGAETEQALQPSTLTPEESLDGIERIKWPAERPHMQLSTASEVPVDEAPAVDQPAATPEVSPEPGPEISIAEEAVGPDVTSEPATVEAAVSEPATVGAAVSEPATVGAAVSEPATVEVKAEALEPDPVIHESTQELPATPEPVPDSIPEPMRSMLIREQEILERLSRALGPDDPGTLTIRGNIAAHYLSAGDVARAADLQEAVAADSARILGDAHPHTLTAQGKAVQWRKLAKKARKPKVPVPS